MKHNNNMKVNKLEQLLFWIPLLMLLSISLLLMVHASFITEVYQNHFQKQCIWIGIGLGIFILSKWLPTDNLFKYSKYLYWGNIFLLILVLIIGKNVNGSRAWLGYKSFSFEPSELMKLSLSLYFARLCSLKKFYNKKEELKFIGLLFLLFLIPSILVFLEPDTGSILFFTIIFLVSLWNTNIHRSWFIISGILGTILLGSFFYLYFYQKDTLINMLGTSIFYRMNRLFSLRKGLQIESALIALGSAPILQFSLTKTGIYIPEAPTDFAFALSSNVFGIIGNYVILFLYLWIDFYLLSHLKKVKEKDLAVFYAIFTTLLISSEVVNISMNLGLIPIIGIPLPFISYGGSSMVIHFCYLAIIFYQKERTKVIVLS